MTTTHQSCATKPQTRSYSGCSWYARGHGINQILKIKADAMEATGQVDGSFQIMSGKLLNSILEGAFGAEERAEHQAVKVLQDLRMSASTGA